MTGLNISDRMKVAQNHINFAVNLIAFVIVQVQKNCIYRNDKITD